MNFQNFFDSISRGQGGGQQQPQQPQGLAAGAAPATSVSSPSPMANTAAAAVRAAAPAPASATTSGGEEEAASGQVVGLEVTQPAFSYSVGDVGLAPEDLPHPQCTPIAFYNSESAYGSGRLVAVSESYICYAIKDGHIRGINRTSVQRTLLKGHKKPVIDMAFAPRAACTLASLGGEGSFFLWTIVETPAEEKKLMPVPLLTVVNAQLQRLVWHPQKAQVLAVAGPNGQVALIDTHALIAALGGGKPGSGPAPQLAAGGMGDLRPEWQVSAHGGSRVLDLSFSLDGKHLVTAGADGWTRVWDVEARTAVARWQPYGGSPVTRALFLHRTRGGASGEKVFVVTGGQQDAEVKLWRAWTTLTPINTQTLSLQAAPAADDGKGRAFHLDADESGEFLLLADHFRPLLYVAHVVLGPSSAKVDRLTPFQLKHPVLSFVGLHGKALDAHEGQRVGGAEVQLYCVQTQAIQIYHIKPAECASGPVANKAALPPPPSSPAMVAATPAPASSSGVGAAASGGQGQAQGQQPDIFSMLLNASQAAKAPDASAAKPPAVVPPPARNTVPFSSGVGAGGGGLLSPGVMAAAVGGGGGGGGGRGGGARGQAAEEEAASTQSAAAALSEEKQTGGARTTEETGRWSSSPSSSSSSLAGRAGPSLGAVPPPVPPAAIPPPQPPAMAAGPVMAGGVGAGGGAGASVATTEAVVARVDAVLRERTEALAAATRQAVADALGGGGGRGGDQLQWRVEAAVRAAVAGQLEGVPAAVAAGAKEAAVAGLAAAVKEPVATSFKECFEKMLIPAMQAATQRMFAQVNDALSKNLAAAAGGGAGAAGPGAAAVTEVRSEIGEVKGQVMALAGAVNALAAQLSRIEANGGGGLLAGKQAAGPTTKAGGLDLSVGQAGPVKEQLRALLRQGRFTDAFQQALGASDLDLVTWLCAEAPRDAIFDADPPLLSQTVLLCLMQQLSFQLGRHPAVKLEWLKQIALVFNPADPAVSGFVGQVLAQLRENLEAAEAEVVALGDAEQGREFKFIQRAVKRMVGGGGGR